MDVNIFWLLQLNTDIKNRDWFDGGISGQDACTIVDENHLKCQWGSCLLRNSMPAYSSSVNAMMLVYCHQTLVLIQVYFFKLKFEKSWEWFFFRLFLFYSISFQRPWKYCNVKGSTWFESHEKSNL